MGLELSPLPSTFLLLGLQVCPYNCSAINFVNQSLTQESSPPFSSAVLPCLKKRRCSRKVMETSSWMPYLWEPWGAEPSGPHMPSKVSCHCRPCIHARSGRHVSVPQRGDQVSGRARDKISAHLSEAPICNRHLEACVGSVGPVSSYFLVSSSITCLPCLLPAGEQPGLSSCVGCVLHRGSGPGSADGMTTVSRALLALSVLAAAWDTHFTAEAQRHKDQGTAPGTGAGLRPHACL